MNPYMPLRWEAAEKLTNRILYLSIQRVCFRKKTTRKCLNNFYSNINKEEEFMKGTTKAD